MKFMVLVKASRDTENGVMPSTELLEEMGKFNEQMVKAGILLAGEGLHASSKGLRIQYSGSKRNVVDGPFAETKELVAGFWILQLKSREEVVEWMKRAPFQDGEIEIRQVLAPEDFTTATPEQIAREEELRNTVQTRQG